MGDFKREVINKDLRHFIFYRDRGRCSYCGMEIRKRFMHIDHIVPVCEGGTNNRCNLTVSCSKCNLKKGGTRLDSEAEIKLITSIALKELYGPNANPEDKQVVEYYIPPIRRSINLCSDNYKEFMCALEMSIEVEDCPMGMVDMLPGLTAYLFSKEQKYEDVYEE